MMVLNADAPHETIATGNPGTKPQSIPLLSMRSIVKKFGGNLVLDHVDLDLWSGETVALLGENGAGKSTLMNILSGLYRADEGEIIFNGTPIRVRSPNDAITLGITMVHQHFELIQNFTVLENIMIGSKRKEKKESVLERVHKLASLNGITIDMNATVKGLPIGVQQKVEILKALYRDPRILILDEPTSNLTPQEVDSMLSTIKRLASSGLSVVFITHKVREALAAASRIIVLKNGRLVGKFLGSEVTAESLVEIMMGARPSSILKPESGGFKAQGKPVLVLSNVSTSPSRHRIALRRINLTVNEGEILGIAGVSGNGQRELVETIMMQIKPSDGSVSLFGKNANSLTTRDIISMGVSYIPEDRLGDGILPNMPVYENLVLGLHDSPPFKKGWMMNRDAILSTASSIVEQYRINPPSIAVMSGVLSGGNIQKLLIARSVLLKPKVIIAHNPTRGLDARTTEFVLKSLVQQSRENGTGVLLLSEDLDELISICDRIAVMFRGEIVGEVEGKEIDRYTIGAMMAGNKVN
jgi:ABC-type uncharacterized transport system ATPase subunit